LFIFSDGIIAPMGPSQSQFTTLQRAQIYQETLFLMSSTSHTDSTRWRDQKLKDSTQLCIKREKSTQPQLQSIFLSISVSGILNLIKNNRTAFVPLPFDKQRPIKRESELHLNEGEIEGVSAYRSEYSKKQTERQHG